MKAFGIAGYSGAGKTTLLERLIPCFSGWGLSVSLIKHAHAGFDIDRPGKDSWRLREAGCTELLLASDKRWVLMHELRGRPEPSLEQQLEVLGPCDLVLVEGFKSSALPKLEVHRPALGKPLLYPENPQVVALATDVPMDVPLPRFDLQDISAIATWMLDYLDIARPVES
ncbi:MAG: molybdopterin-guanine dinucleotide biosynthesis protein B [Rhodocyclaceae bacterium]|nr:molybdopterin-guanine dinucleotide biosynthesis protein B [Rhodocyclaceae bacterium]MBX3670522.1 molybdopterin-guanine dinucleotide biosynthesis protein B [Rhodocyclaceae bacterium]